MRPLTWMACLLGTMATGCASLLPSSRNTTACEFATYEAARQTLEQTQPYRTTLQDLKRLGFDATGAANVRQVPYPQWTAMLMHPSEPLDSVDPGVRDCLAARDECRALLFKCTRVAQDRQGGFLADFFNFRRITLTHGWRFEATVLVRGDVVLFRNHGGEPRVEELDDRSNPLGPLQSLGESGLRP